MGPHLKGIAVNVVFLWFQGHLDQSQTFCHSDHFLKKDKDLLINGFPTIKELVNIAIRDIFYDLDARDFCLLAVLIVF